MCPVVDVATCRYYHGEVLAPPAESLQSVVLAYFVGSGFGPHVQPCVGSNKVFGYLVDSFETIRGDPRFPYPGGFARCLHFDPYSEPTSLVSFFKDSQSHQAYPVSHQGRCFQIPLGTANVCTVSSPAEVLLA